MNALGEPASVLVLGGTSEIAAAIVDRLVTRGTRRVVLAGRDQPALAAAGAPWAARGVDVGTVAFDAADPAGHAAALDTAFVRDVDLVLLAFGVLGDQMAFEADPAAAVAAVTTNYVGAVSAGLQVARRFRTQGHGTLVVLSSVAGVRARRANFVYGSSKAGLDAFAQGLGDALAGTGCRVMVVRPGFVRGRMTAGMAPAPLATTPEAVAEVVVRGLARGSEVVYVPPPLAVLAAALRLLPRALFRRLPDR